MPYREPQPPPVASSYHGVYQGRTFGHLGDLDVRGASRLEINGEEVRNGVLAAKFLAMMGIEERRLDQWWIYWAVTELGLPHIEYPVGGLDVDRYAIRHQDGAGWTVECTVVGNDVKELDDLAYVDLREVTRKVTFRRREWNYLSKAEVEARGGDISKDRWSYMGSDTRPLEPAAALGAWLHHIDEEDIRTTRDAAHALEDARQELRWAYEEIERAIRLADAAWHGDRGDAAKFHFCVEASVVEAIGHTIHGWEDFTQDVVRFQRQAEAHDAEFKKMLAREGLIFAATFLLTAGLGSLARGSVFVGRMAAWSERMAGFRALMNAAKASTLARVARYRGVIVAARALYMGTAEGASRAGVKTAMGEDVTMGDWLWSYALAGGGSLVIDGALAVGRVATRFKVRFGGSAGTRWGDEVPVPGRNPHGDGGTPGVGPRPGGGGGPRPARGPGTGTRPGAGSGTPAGGGPRGRGLTDAQRRGLRDTRARDAAVALQARPELKLDPGAATTDALETMFGRTLNAGRNTARRPGQHLPNHTRAAASEIRTITEWARRPDVVRIEAVPSAAGGRSPDFIVWVRNPDGTVTPTRVEVVTATGAGNRYVGRGPVTSTPATVETIEARLLSKVPAGRPGQLTAPLPGVPTGGTVAVHIPQPGPNGAQDVADAMRRLAPELAKRPELTRVEFYLPGQAPIVYARQPAGTYVQI